MKREREREKRKREKPITALNRNLTLSQREISKAVENIKDKHILRNRERKKEREREREREREKDALHIYPSAA